MRNALRYAFRHETEMPDLRDSLLPGDYLATVLLACVQGEGVPQTPQEGGKA
jgi:hypothetical protein